VCRWIAGYVPFDARREPEVAPCELVYGAMPGSLRPEDIVPRLRGRLGRPYRFVDRCASTQRLLGEGDPEGAVAVADEQTEGRGRLGRRWLAPAGTSLLCSILLRPGVDPAKLPVLSVVAGRACAEAIADLTGLEPDVKFPNDVLLRGRKVAGILAEASEGRVVLGVGINVAQGPGQLPPNTRTPATSLLVETGRAADRGDLLLALLERLEGRYDEWLASARAVHD
jgi:BirA family transcriptional regulator, biotin operon repressor / biotin---[acetyl-CoA-carboxylase] ligase